MMISQNKLLSWRIIRCTIVVSLKIRKVSNKKSCKHTLAAWDCFSPFYTSYWMVEVELSHLPLPTKCLFWLDTFADLTVLLASFARHHVNRLWREVPHNKYRAGYYSQSRTLYGPTVAAEKYRGGCCKGKLLEIAALCAAGKAFLLYYFLPYLCNFPLVAS